MPDVAVAVMRCTACGRLDPGPRDLCPGCFSALAPAEVGGSGRLVSWTMIRRPPLAFKDEKQYAVAVVALDAGCQVTGRLASPDESVKPGTRVRAVGRHGAAAVFDIAE
ncbi:MAG: OB-fold domain-containing protein [Hyphomicrobiales bacterium]|nr:OB-fold domain-containing protein [Hyphomicrobiales bacterium]